MIYTIESGTRIVALTNERNAIDKFSNCTIRWSNESERETFRRLESQHKRKRWFVPRLNAALWSVFRVLFWPLYRNV